MSSVFLNGQASNQDPIAPGFFQEWAFDGPQSESGAFLISAIAASTPGPQQSDTLMVEDVRVETTRTILGDPLRRLHFHVRNVGPSTIDKYFVNVYLVAP